MAAALMLGAVLVVSGLLPARTYLVETSTDLRGWSAFWLFSSDDGGDRCFFADSPANQRFYRVGEFALPAFRSTCPLEPL